MRFVIECTAWAARGDSECAPSLLETDLILTKIGTGFSENWRVTEFHNIFQKRVPKDLKIEANGHQTVQSDIFLG